MLESRRANDLRKTDGSAWANSRRNEAKSSHARLRTRTGKPSKPLSKIDAVSPRHPIPRAEGAEPNRAIDFGDGENSTSALSKVGKVKPGCERLRGKRDELRTPASKIKREKSRLAMPQTESNESAHAKLRSRGESPRCEPSRTGGARSSCAEDRANGEGSEWLYSSAGTASPMCPRERADTTEPSVQLSNTNEKLPKHNLLARSSNKPGCPKDCEEIKDPTVS